MKIKTLFLVPFVLLAGCDAGSSTSQVDVDQAAKQLTEASKNSPDYGPDPAALTAPPGGASGAPTGAPKPGRG